MVLRGSKRHITPLHSTSTSPTIFSKIIRIFASTTTKQKYMKRANRHTLLVLLLSLSGVIHAQNGLVELGVRGGNNATFGNFGAISLVAEHNFGEQFTLKGGILSTTFDRFSAEVRPSYEIKTSFGALHFEALLHHSSQSSLQTSALGGGVGVRSEHLWATFGYYCRTLGSRGEMLTEPFNLYYEFGVNCLPMLPEWDLKATFSNSRIFDLDRHYLPSLSIDGWWYPSNKVAVRLGASYTPTGIFHISSDYYQLYTSLGLCYRW